MGGNCIDYIHSNVNLPASYNIKSMSGVIFLTFKPNIIKEFNEICVQKFYIKTLNINKNLEIILKQVEN